MLGVACGGAPTPTPAPAPAPPSVPTPTTEPTTPSPAPPPWSDAWILAEGERFLNDDEHRRAALERSLVNHDNLYSKQRLASYGLGDRRWDRLPAWNPRSRPVTAELADQLRRGEVPSAPEDRLWDGALPTTMDGWVELGRRVFFGYPMRAEVYMEWGLTKPTLAASVGVARSRDGGVPGLVVFRDVDQQVRVGITCAICHTAVDDDGAVIEGAARRSFDYGRLRLAYFDDTGEWVDPNLARRMATWGPGRADVTEDDDEDPVAIPDLWGLRDQRFLTQAGTIRHESPLALVIRQETQLTDSNHTLVRPPRALAWALAMYVYSLSPPPHDDEVAGLDRSGRGAALFREHCGECHTDEGRGGRVIAAEAIGTDPALATSRGRGTGNYRVAPLVRIADGAPYLHDGSVATLGELLSPARLQPDYRGGHLGPGAIPGHLAGTSLGDDDRVALIEFLRTM